MGREVSVVFDIYSVVNFVAGQNMFQLHHLQCKIDTASVIKSLVSQLGRNSGKN